MSAYFCADHSRGRVGSTMPCRIGHHSRPGDLHHARVGQELAEIAPDVRGRGRGRGTEGNQQHRGAARAGALRTRSTFEQVLRQGASKTKLNA